MPHLLRRIFLHGLALSLGAALSATAADPAKAKTNAKAQPQLRVVLFAVPETIWQSKLEGQYRDHADLHTRLEDRVRQGEAAREVVALCGLKHDGEPLEWKRGEMRKFTTGWQLLEKGLGVKPEKFTEEFIGTTLGITDERVLPDGASTIELALQHHTAPPAMRRINFAQAAEGAERDRLSVEYPTFTKLEWRGRTALSHDWRLVAQLRQAPGENEGEKDKASAAPAPALRYLLFTSAAGAADAEADDKNATREVRQVVIRAPELEVLGLMADTTTAQDGTSNSTEASRIAALWQAVQAGRARIISDLTSAAAANGKFSAKHGLHVWLPTELEQDTERLQMPPLSHGEYFAGTALECTGTSDDMTLQWKGVCVPRGPARVQWPVSWLNLWIHQKPDPQKRLIRGWLDFHDTFQQEALGRVTLRSPRQQILAIMPPADQVFPASPAAGPGRWLDVFLAQVKAPGQQVPAGLEPEPAPEAAPAPAPAPALPLDPFAPQPQHLPKAARPLPQGQANMVYGISIGTLEAATLLRQRDPAQDAALLEKLVARVRAGTARLHLCAGSGHDLQSGSSMTSARVHQVPSEMPSIPSAWQDRFIGTTLEMEHRDFALHQDLAPPGRSEWKLALDDPQAVMWQPRLRSFRLQGETPTLRGTHLVGLLQIPEVMRQPGSGLDTPEAESILIFAQYHGGHAFPGNADNDSEHPPFEAELIVLEMPGTSVDDFQGLPGDPQPGEEEDERFTQLMSRVPTGEVRIAARTLVTGGRGQVKAIIGEEHQHATEFDPPESATPRMRPTALETVHAGTELEMDVAFPNAPPFEIIVDLTFKHSLGLPIEPSLLATLAIAAKDESGPYPAGEHPQEIWTSSDNHPTTGSSSYRLRDNQPFCLGARKPPGVERRVIHVAYLRVRRL